MAKLRVQSFSISIDGYGAGLVDEMHAAISPVLLGRGEQLLTGLDLPRLGYVRSERVATANATHFVLTRKR